MPLVGTTRMFSTPEHRTEAKSVDLAVAWVLYNVKYNSALRYLRLRWRKNGKKEGRIFQEEWEDICFKCTAR